MQDMALDFLDPAYYGISVGQVGFLIWVKLIKHGRVCDYRMAVGASIGEGVTFSQKTTGGFKVFRSHPRDCCRLLKSKIKLVKTFYLLSLTLLQPHM